MKKLIFISLYRYNEILKNEELLFISLQSETRKQRRWSNREIKESILAAPCTGSNIHCVRAPQTGGDRKTTIPAPGSRGCMTPEPAEDFREVRSTTSFHGQATKERSSKVKLLFLTEVLVGFIVGRKHTYRYLPSQVESSELQFRTRQYSVSVFSKTIHTASCVARVRNSHNSNACVARARTLTDNSC